MKRIIYILLLSSMFVIACKKEKPEVMDDPPTGGFDDSVKESRYDIKDFTLDLFSESRVIPGKMIKLNDGSILGITLEKDRSYRLIKTSDVYGNWTEVYNKGNRVYDINADVDGTIYAVSQEGLLISTNNGSTWNVKTFSGITWGTDLQSATTMNISIHNGIIMIARNWGSYPTNDVFLSSDYGVTFSKVLSTPIATYNQVYVLQSDLMYIVSPFKEIRRSTNATNWTSIYKGAKTGSFYYDISKNVLFSNYNDIAKRSNDKGNTWQSLPSKHIPILKMANGDYLTQIFAHGVYRSNDGGVSWLPLSQIKNSIDGIVEQGNKLVLTEGSGIYILEYGKTYWNYIPKYEPVNYYYNFGAKNLYAFNGQLFVRKDEKSPWRLTLTFDNSRRIVYYTKSYRNDIYLFTQNTFGSSTVMHQINSEGTYIKHSENLPWTGGVSNFVSEGAKIVCVFQGGTDQDKDLIVMRDYLSGSWKVRDVSPQFNKIHFLELIGTSIVGNKTLGIGYEDRTGKNYQSYASILFSAFTDKNDQPVVQNFAGSGWPGFYEYDKLHRLYTTNGFRLAFLDDDMFVGTGISPNLKWDKSFKYPTMDPNLKNILRYSAFTPDGYPINSVKKYGNKIEIEQIN